MRHQAVFASLTLAPGGFKNLEVGVHWSALCNSSEATESVTETGAPGCLSSFGAWGARREKSVELSSDVCQAAQVLGLWCLRGRRSQGWRPSKNLKVPPPRRGLESRGLCSQVRQLTPEDPQPVPSSCLADAAGKPR